jgi:proline iminopeptidase
MLDPRGTGKSDRPADAGAYTIEDYVSDLDELRAHLGQDQIRLLGHSHGGVVAAAYAAEHPDRVDRLVLASTPARFHNEQHQAMHAAMATRADEPWYADAVAALETEQNGAFHTDEELTGIVMRELPLYFARFGEAEAAYIEKITEPVNGDALGLFNKEIFPTFDLRPRLPNITAKTLIITGESDFITGPICAADFDPISDQRTVTVPDAGHFIFIETPLPFHQQVRDFLLQ